MEMNPTTVKTKQLSRLCDEALSGNLTIDQFYHQIGDETNFSGFLKLVAADVLDYLEHQTTGQDWQKLDLAISQELLRRSETDAIKTAARAYLRKHLMSDRTIAEQVEEYMKAGPKQGE